MIVRTAFWTDPDNGILALRLALAVTMFLNGWSTITRGIDFQMGMLAARGILR